jgi:DnaJ family protein A protein 2
MIDPEKRCKDCKGKKVKKDRKKLKVEMDKGTPQGEQFIVHGEGDCVPEVEHGDVIVVVKIRPNKSIVRKGADLMIEKEITLLEALTGIDFTFTHLDGRVVRIQNNAGEIIKPDSMMTCEDLGMPFHKSPYKFGNLFIKFNIKFPERMSPTQIEAANSILTTQKKSAIESKDFDAVTEKVNLVKFEERHKNTHA